MILYKKKQIIMDKISCLCITRKRVDYLKRAIQSFRDQSYKNKELVIVYESDDIETLDFLHSITDTNIVKKQIDISPKKTLGALRNIAINTSSGDFFAQWDDDDVSDSKRLEFQYKQLKSLNKQACVLRRWRMYDRLKQEVYISNYMDVVGGGENTILCRKELLTTHNIAYPELARGEDTAVIEWLIIHDHVTALDKPELYTYEVSGLNTWHRQHFEDIFSHSCYKASDEVTNIVLQQMTLKS
jgi:glycosyltransferase involved in cell wall biosynthesis